MPRPMRLLPYIFFVISGACGLVYEVTWARYLGLFLGNTTLAHMCVLGAFMGGLALGSFALGSASNRVTRPLYAYGWLEIGIGLYAVLFPFFIHRLETMTLSAGSGLEFGSSGWVALKLAVSAAALLMPTFLMGGTFPVLMRHFRPTGSQSHDKAEWLYLTNCAGAVVGALLAGFLFIPGLGLRGTLTGVGLANAALGLIALGVSLTVSRASTPEDVASSQTEPRSPLLRPVYIAIGVSGVAAMIYELAWIRIFAVTLGSSTYSFTLMVAAFITGLALGSLVVGVVPWTRAKPLLWFAAAEAAIGIAVTMSIPLYEKLPYTFWKLSYLLRPSAESMWLHSALKYSLCFAVMLVPTVFSGMTLPLAIKAAARKGSQIGRDSGFIYGANTAGTLAGAALAGLALIPAFGVRHSLEIAVIMNLAAAGLLFLLTDIGRVRTVIAGGCAATAVLLFTAPQWNPVSFSRGTFRERIAAPESWRAYQSGLNVLQVLYSGEDGGSSVAVAETPERTDYPGELTLFVDGKADGSAYGDMPTQMMVGHLPLFFKPRARDVLMVGLGTGVSAGSALTHPNVRLDCVEISPSVVEAAKLFGDYNKGCLDNPRMKLFVEDARTMVAVSRKRYDVIINEPSNPWVAGMGNLFSLDFFQSADRVLKPDGVIVQWFHTYEISDDLVGVIIRTMRQVFPYAYIFQGSENDYIVLGSRQPIAPDFAAMDNIMRTESVRRDLAGISVDSTAALLGLQVLSAEGSAKLAGKGVVNSDDRPVLEYTAPVAQYVNAKAQIWKQADERLWKGNRLFSVWYLAGRTLDRNACRSMIRVYSDRRISQPKLLRPLLEYYVERWPNEEWALSAYTKLARGTDAPAALKIASANLRWQTLETLADDEATRRLRSMSAFTPQDFSTAIGLLDRAIAGNPSENRLKSKRDQLQRLTL